MAKAATGKTAKKGTFAADLQAAREHKRLSRAEVARRMRSQPPAVTRIESGRIDVKESTVRRYAGAIGCRVSLSLTGRKG